MASVPSVFVGGAWHTIKNEWVFVSGAWHVVSNAWIFVGGAWHKYYQQLFAFTYASKNDANIYTDAHNAGWDFTSPLVVTIPAGVSLTASSTGTFGLDTGPIASTVPLSLIIAGKVIGHGGAGGVGGSALYIPGVQDRDHQQAGGTGGAAGGAFNISTACPITINLTGTIAGGGGGGGGGGNAVVSYGSAAYHSLDGGAGGAGYGPSSQAGGAGGGTYYYSGSYGAYGGTAGSGGAGGAAATGGGSGGTGSTFGRSGTAGSGGGGGGAGRAITLSGHARPTFTAGDNGTNIKGLST